MKHAQHLITALLSLLLFTTAAYHVKAARSYANTHTTTILVHGYGSNYHAEETLAHAMVKSGASNSIIRADVTTKGKVTFHGHQAANAKNPIVEMNYSANVVPKKSFDENNYAGQMKAVIKADQQKYGTKQINLVGHSMGNMLTVQYMNDNYSDHSLPAVKHLVILAGGDKKPYRSNITSKLNGHLPKGLDVLNVYSNYQNGSDGRVQNSDSRYWKHTFGSANEYKEVKLSGLKHSQLHESSRVTHLVTNFLFH